MPNLDKLNVDFGGGGSQWGTGGMATKLKAARMAGAAGIRTVILNAKNPGGMLKVLKGSRDVGTVFEPLEMPVRASARVYASASTEASTVSVISTDVVGTGSTPLAGSASASS